MNAGMKKLVMQEVISASKMLGFIYEKSKEGGYCFFKNQKTSPYFVPHIVNNFNGIQLLGFIGIISQEFERAWAEERGVSGRWNFCLGLYITNIQKFMAPPLIKGEEDLKVLNAWTLEIFKEIDKCDVDKKFINRLGVNGELFGKEISTFISNDEKYKSWRNWSLRN